MMPVAGPVDQRRRRCRRNQVLPGPARSGKAGYLTTDPDAQQKGSAGRGTWPTKRLEAACPCKRPAQHPCCSLAILTVHELPMSKSTSSVGFHREAPGVVIRGVVVPSA